MRNFLLSGRKHSKLILYSPCPSHGISYFSKSPGSFYLGNSTSKTKIWVLGVIASRLSQQTEVGNICLHTNNYIYNFLCGNVGVVVYLWLPSVFRLPLCVTPDRVKSGIHYSQYIYLLAHQWNIHKVDSEFLIYTPVENKPTKSTVLVYNFILSLALEQWFSK